PVDGDLVKVPSIPAEMAGGVHMGPGVGEEGNERYESFAGPMPQARFLQIREGGEKRRVMPVLPEVERRHVTGEGHADVVHLALHALPPAAPGAGPIPTQSGRISGTIAPPRPAAPHSAVVAKSAATSSISALIRGDQSAYCRIIPPRRSN